MTQDKQIIVIGAGITGLTAAGILSEAGFSVTVLERESEVGGLARTFQYDDFRFDIGPHRFHSHDPIIKDYIQDILKQSAKIIGRKSSVYFQNRYFSWPLRGDALIKMPLRISLKCLLDLLRKSNSHNGGESFQDYVMARYGKTLYELFFKQYTEKFAYCSCDQLHGSWASASVDRAIIDRRIQMNGLRDVARMVLLPKPVETEFIYPSAGCGQFSKIQHENVISNNGRVITRCGPLKLTCSEDCVQTVSITDESFVPDWIIWTGSLPALCQQLNREIPHLNYMNTAVFNILLKKSPTRQDQWIYFSSKSIIFARVSNPAAFDPENVPHSKGAICVEVMCHEQDWWADPGRLTSRVIRDLAVTGLISNDDVEAVFIEKIPESYPVYALDYLQERSRALKDLSRFENLLPAGRCGAFVYNNMDDSILLGMEAAAKIIHQAVS